MNPEEVLVKNIEKQLHGFILNELDEQDRMREKKPRETSYPRHQRNASEEIIRLVREHDAEHNAYDD